MESWTASKGLLEAEARSWSQNLVSKNSQKLRSQLQLLQGVYQIKNLEIYDFYTT